jgi:hypothetical protein
VPDAKGGLPAGPLFDVGGGGEGGAWGEEFLSIENILVRQIELILKITKQL